MGTAYSQTLAATGDTPITWSIESGSLPEGLSLESETGVISGIPTTVGTASFTVKATNAAGSDTKALSIDIAAVGDNDVVPDINLRAAINEQLEVSNSDAPISKTQMESLQGDLSIVNKSVINLAGLQYAKNVTKLNLADNQISDLSPLSGLTNLEYLTLNNNQITNLSPMFGLTNLTLLSLTNNQISNLSSLSKMTKMEYLDLGLNQITNLSSLSEMTNLIMIGLNNNQISDLSPLSSMTKMQFLILNDNQISNSSPLSGMTDMLLLNLTNNQIRDLNPLSSMINKTQINADKQHISVSADAAVIPNPLKAIDGAVVPITADINAKNKDDDKIELLNYDSMTEPSTVQFQDSRTDVSTKKYEFGGQLEITKEIGSIAPAITTALLPGGTVGSAYSQTLIATGDTPITWSIESGSLPAGLSLEASTGIISGTPATVETASFTIKATNAAGSDTKALSIDITAEVTITYGDVNDDGTIDITDAVRVLKHITAPSTLNVQQQIAANVSGDGIIDITDAVLILKHITSPTTPFPVEKL